MTITFLELYNEVSGQPWSMFDNDAESVEDFESSMKISINKAISYLWNLRPWDFRYNVQNVKVKKGKVEYPTPNGILYDKCVEGENYYGLSINGKYLTYAKNIDLFNKKEESTPKEFSYVGDKLVLNPIPDKDYVMKMEYSILPFGLSKDGKSLYELKEDDDYINIPEKYETLFKNCVISLAMIYAIADFNDENHSGYEKQYEDALNILMLYCLNSSYNRSIVW